MREWLVALSGGLTLAFTAWGLGGIPTWSLHVLLAGGLLTFTLALCPLPGARRWKRRGQISYDGRTTSLSPELAEGVSSGASSSDTELSSSSSAAESVPTSSRRIAEKADQPLNSRMARTHFPLSTLHFPLQSLKRLARWPFFYFSLAFLIYLLIGALNPAAEIVRDERGWWVEAIQPRFALWLPTSVLSDYQPMNAWRVLASFTAAFTLAWGLWAGLTRRAPVLLVLWCLLLSGAGMGLVGILQHLSEAKAVLWTFPSSNVNFWGSFFYRNQGAAYLNLILILSGFLFFYHGVKTREKLRSGGPHFFCFLIFALTAASIGLALSRGGILFAGILSCTFLALLLVFLIQGIFHLSSIWLAVIPLALLASGAFLAIRYIDLEAIETRFGDIGETIESADQDARAISSKATWDMAQDRLALGWGAGSFRYIFPMYQRNYPELFHNYYHKQRQQWMGRKMYRYAHNDILQFLAEYGAIGCGLLLLAFGSIIFTILKNAFHFPLSTFHLLVGLATITAHAFLDFIFNSPAYWMAFVALLAVATKLLKLEQARGGLR